ncbi:MAG: hypothetical protein KDC38_12305 [Planctomycetes bacterium]|nr:hypothetical protein [Planctomycetota bacterium]
MNDEDDIAWEELIATAQRYVERCQDDLRRRLRARERFDVDLEAGTLTFVDGDVVHARASFLVAGTYTETTRTWLWSWADPALPAHLTEELFELRDYGIDREFEYLSEERFQIELDDAWLLAGVACYLLRARAVYRHARSGVDAFLLAGEVDGSGAAGSR